MIVLPIAGEEKSIIVKKFNIEKKDYKLNIK